VVALEIDPRMASEVRKRAMGAGRRNLEVLEGNALTTEWPTFQVCTANLPYAISSPFTFKLLAHRPLFRCAVLMFQLEFALRLVAEVGDPNYGRLALNTKLFVKVSTVCKVSRGSFNPPPEVDSMVVKVVPRDPPIEVNFREWDGLMRIVFVRKRKTLAASFKMTSVLKTLEENYKTWCALTSTAPSKKPMKDMIMEVLNEKGLAEKRAITIDLDTYFLLLLAFNQKGIHFSGTPTAGVGKEVKDSEDRFFEDMDEDGE
jgi:18S rRNA (adenine1779-N6/adenine1780-N6)-dimethyltransferase